MLPFLAYMQRMVSHHYCERVYVLVAALLGVRACHVGYVVRRTKVIFVIFKAPSPPILPSAVPPNI